MDLQLQDKRVLITGSTSGIGEAIAQTLVVKCRGTTVRFYEARQ